MNGQINILERKLEGDLREKVKGGVDLLGMSCCRPLKRKKKPSNKLNFRKRNRRYLISKHNKQKETQIKTAISGKRKNLEINTLNYCR